MQLTQTQLGQSFDNADDDIGTSLLCVMCINENAMYNI